MKGPCVLLDRDGTIIEDGHYLADPDGVRLLPGAAEGLRRLVALGWRLVVVSNQSGLARGLISPEALQAVNGRMEALLAREGVALEGIFFCPHGPDEGCRCRKPKTGLVVAAAEVLGFDPSRSVVIGDKMSDIGLGLNLGVPSLLVRTGYGRETERRERPQWLFAVDDLVGAALAIGSAEDFARRKR